MRKRQEIQELLWQTVAHELNKFAEPLAFAVYTIDKNIFQVGSILLDKMRALLYKIFRIDKLVVRLGQAIEHGFNKAGSLL